MFLHAGGIVREVCRHGKATFKKFDEDGSGDIDVCELSDMLRFQGHHTSIDEAAGQDPVSPNIPKLIGFKIRFVLTEFLRGHGCCERFS